MYDEVEPYRAIALHMSDGRTARTTFEDDGNYTKVTTVFDAELQNSIDMQRSGFRRYVER